MTDLRGRRVLATGFHTPDIGSVADFTRAVIDIGPDGVIRSVTAPGEAGYDPAGAVDLTDALLIPGLVDLHVHAPQYPQLGTALDVPLEEWLHRYTFPLEARYADLGFARAVYAGLIDDLLAAGTTAAVYFATIHDDATCLLADLCIEKGQRALVGRVAMDHPDNPAFYRDADAAAAVEGTRAVIAHIRAHPGNADARVRPIITPRFVPACTDDCLAALGALATETGVAVQTHVSESDWEHGAVLARHGMSDTESLDRFGLVTPHGVLAHGVFLSAGDLALIRERGAGVAHCPVSNAYFAGAVFPLRRVLEAGVHVGLGSDISGGPQGTVWEAARGALMAARMLESGVDPDRPTASRGSPGARVDAVAAFHVATRGGAVAAGLPCGAFLPGLAFDALALRPGPGGALRLDPGEAGARRLERVLHRTARGDIARVWVGGRCVAGC
jgi:guanine deaminase